MKGAITEWSEIKICAATIELLNAEVHLAASSPEIDGYMQYGGFVGDANGTQAPFGTSLKLEAWALRVEIMILLEMSHI